MTPRDALVARMRHAIASAYRLIEAGNRAGYVAELRRIVTRGHLAAALAGSADRRRTRRVRDVLRDVLTLRSAREMLAIRRRLARELDYLNAFARAMPDLSLAHIAARAQMYAGAVRGTYDRARWGDWDIPEHLWPGNQRCRSNCRCTIDVRDLGNGAGELIRTLHPAEHCPDCLALAGKHRIRRRRL